MINVRNFFTGILLILLFAATTQSQSIQLQPVLQSGQAAGEPVVTYAGPSSGETWNIRFHDNTLQFYNQELTFNDVYDYDLSPDSRHLGMLMMDENANLVTAIINYEGEMVAMHTLQHEVELSDPSLKLYLLAEGNIVIRDNIVGFTVYSYTGGLVDRVSNSSGSPDGETMSRLVSSRDGSQVYVYNPRIIQGDGFSTRVSKLSFDGTIDNIYVDTGVEIVNLKASDDGEMIFAVTRSTDGTMQVRKIDSLGNVRASHTSEFSSPGYYVQPELNTVTWFEGNNAQVYDIGTGSRIANAFFSRQTVVFAKFEPEDNLVLTITGTRSTRDGRINANGFRAVDLDARALVHSNDISLEMNFNPDNEPEMKRVSRNRFLIYGVSNAQQVVVNR